MIGWVLVAMVASGLVAVGLAALIVPATAASQYGIVVEDRRALAFVRAMGVRDLVIGLLLGLLSASGSRALVAWALYATTLIALLDFVVVTRDVSTPAASRRRSPRALHAAGAIGIALAGAVVQWGY